MTEVWGFIADLLLKCGAWLEEVGHRAWPGRVGLPPRSGLLSASRAVSSLYSATCLAVLPCLGESYELKPAPCGCCVLCPSDKKVAKTDIKENINEGKRKIKRKKIFANSGTKKYI